MAHNITGKRDLAANPKTRVCLNDVRLKRDCNESHFVNYNVKTMASNLPIRGANMGDEDRKHDGEEEEEEDIDETVKAISYSPSIYANIPKRVTKPKKTPSCSL